MRRGACDRGLERLQVHRLLEEVDRALLHRAHGGGDVAVAGEEDDGQRGIVGAQRLEQQ